MPRGRSILIAIALVGLLGSTAIGSPGATLVGLEGQAGISGNAPFLNVIFATGGAGLEVTGGFLDELRKLQGVPLRVIGWRKDGVKPGFGPFLEVLAYAPVADGYGKSPRLVTGVLSRQRDGWFLADLGSARLFRLVGRLPAGIEAADGAKVLLRGKTVKGHGPAVDFAADGVQVLAPAGKYRLGGEEQIGK
jgi:hypothetical protein